MRLCRSRTALSLVLGAALLATGCGTKDDAATDEAATEDTVSQEEGAADQGSATPAAEPAGPSSSAPLTVADIDRWQRGMEAELKAVREAGAKLKSAKTGTDTVSAMFAANDMSTRDAGAKAAGVDPERYQFIRTTLSSAAAYLGPMEMDTTGMPKSMVEELKKGRESGLARMSTELPPEVQEALRPRAAELRKQDLMLTGERLKASGIGGG
jgi:hypothetical protein